MKDNVGDVQDAQEEEMSGLAKELQRPAQIMRFRTIAADSRHAIVLKWTGRSGRRYWIGLGLRWGLTRYWITLAPHLAQRLP